MKAVDLDAIEWERLTIEALWTLSRIALPMIDGELQSEAGRRLGLSRAQIGKHMSQLRAELREQLDQETAA